MKKKNQKMENFVEIGWHKIAQKILENHRLIMLVGEPGTGKSTWATQISKHNTGQEPEIIQGTPDTEMNHIFGFFSLANGETRFCDGPLPLALKNERYLLVEEFNLIPLETRSSLLALRGRESITNPFTGEKIAISPDFRLIATSNSENVKCARNSGVARALFDDFLTMEVPPVSLGQIKQWLSANYPAADGILVERVCTLWEEYREISDSHNTKNKIRLSYRAADHLLKLILSGMEEKDAVEIALVNKYIIDEDAHTTAKLQSSLKMNVRKDVQDEN